MEISRDDLYAAVWRAPMKHLAVEFDVPVDQLVRACRELAVPRPVQGHWPLVSLGKHPGVRPLPPAPAGTPSHARLQRAIQAAPLIQPPRKAPSTETHPILEVTRDALAKAKADERGRLLLPAGRRLLNVRVTAAQRDRAVAILDAVIRSFATVDATLDVQRIHDGAPFKSWCLIDGETIAFHLEEWVRSKLRPPAPGEKLAWHQLFRGQVRTFEPTGMLTLELDFEEGSHVRRRWEDSANGTLESKLHKIPDGLVAAASAIRGRREEVKRTADARATEDARREAADEEVARKARLIDNALQMRSQWQTAHELRQFVAAADRALLPEHRDAAFTEWLELVMAHADSIDPLWDPAGVKARLCSPKRADWRSDPDLGVPLPAFLPVYRRY